MRRKDGMSRKSLASSGGRKRPGLSLVIESFASTVAPSNGLSGSACERAKKPLRGELGSRARYKVVPEISEMGGFAFRDLAVNEPERSRPVGLGYAVVCRSYAHDSVDGQQQHALQTSSVRAGPFLSSVFSHRRVGVYCRD